MVFHQPEGGDYLTNPALDPVGKMPEYKVLRSAARARLAIPMAWAPSMARQSLPHAGNRLYFDEPLRHGQATNDYERVGWRPPYGTAISVASLMMIGPYLSRVVSTVTFKTWSSPEPAASKTAAKFLNT